MVEKMKIRGACDAVDPQVVQIALLNISNDIAESPSSQPICAYRVTSDLIVIEVTRVSQEVQHV